MPTFFHIFYAVAVFIFGSAVGSFLNVVAYRVPRHESLIKGRSHCTTCNKQIANYDLIPILSWIFLGGRCRHCKEKISPRYMIIELLTALLYLLGYLVLGISIQFAFAVVLFPLLVVLSLNDIDRMEIPYWTSISIAVLGVISVVIDILTPNAMPWYEHLIGAVIISVPFAILTFLGAMGGGDVHLMAAAGLLLGWKIVPAAAIGIVLGALGGLIIKIVTKNSQIKFGPFLSVGIVIGYLFGTDIINWYLSFIM